MVTTHEQTRAGFLNIALEKNKVGDPYVKNALAFKAMVANTKGPDEFLDMPEIRPFVLTASGLSEKSMKYLDEGDQTAAIKELIENFLKPSGSDYIDETIYRYLLIKGDAVGGTMRNRIGALGEERLIRAILSNMNVQGIEYDWMANIQGSFPWAHKSCDDTEIEKNMKALHWKNSKGDRVLGFNLNVPTVKKNVEKDRILKSKRLHQKLLIYFPLSSPFLSSQSILRLTLNQLYVNIKIFLRCNNYLKNPLRNESIRGSVIETNEVLAPIYRC